jgi:hypothetical protein
MVKTSFSSASLHIGRCCSIQKDFLHAEQEVDTARPSGWDDDWEVERGMIMLLVKQVHLQNEGGAERVLVVWIRVEVEDLHPAKTVNMRVKIRKRTDSRAMSSDNGWKCGRGYLGYAFTEKKGLWKEGNIQEMNTISNTAQILIDPLNR